MNIDECFELGHVVKPHGLKGDVDVYLDTDHPEHYQTLQTVFIEQAGQLIPFSVRSVRIDMNRARFQFEGVETIDESQKLKGATLYLPLDLLPPLEGKRFYLHEIIGFEVHGKEEGRIGTIQRVLEYPGQRVLAVTAGDAEILIPVNDDIVKEVDRKAKVIHVVLPPGLLDIYTS